MASVNDEHLAVALNNVVGRRWQRSVAAVMLTIRPL